MKKIGVLIVLAITLSLTSCYNTRVCVGNVQKNDAVVQVNSHRNDIFLFGLIPTENAKTEAPKYVDKQSNYMVRTNQTFVDGLLSVITFGIYTPTTTTYYVPLQNIQKK